jgi:hypothetical protein
MKKSILLALSLFALPAWSTTIFYRCQEEQGPVFANKPFVCNDGKQAESIKKEPVKTIDPTRNLNKPKNITEEVEQEKARRENTIESQENTQTQAPTNYNMSIVSPANNSSSTNQGKGIQITVNISPQLYNQHQLHILLDNKPVQTFSNEASSFSANAIPDRGEHQVSAQIINSKDNQVLAQSESITVFAKWPIVKKTPPAINTKNQ